MGGQGPSGEEFVNEALAGGQAYATTKPEGFGWSARGSMARCEKGAALGIPVGARDEDKELVLWGSDVPGGGLCRGGRCHDI